MATKKASPAQIAARKLFAERAKAGTLTKKRKTNPVKTKKNPIYDANKVAKRGRYVVYWNVTNGNVSKILTLDVSKADAVRIAKHKATAGYHTYVENGDTGEVVFDSEPWYKKNPIPKGEASSIKNALTALRRLVKSGVEYPDAEYKISGKYGVTGAALRRAYDAYYVNVTPKRKSNPVKPGVQKSESNKNAARYAELYGGAPATLRAWNDHYIVMWKRENDSAWSSQSVFPKKADAVQYARAYARQHPALMVKVVTPD